jgi:hypothetical protein
MNILYAEPISRAWKRMSQALFAPFDVHKWFVIGFNAFLAGLADWNHGSGGSRGGVRFDAGEVFSFPHRAWTWLMAHPGWFAGILVLAFLLFIVGTVITLPVWYFLRAFSLEFLGQFGPEYTLPLVPVGVPVGVGPNHSVDNK